MPSSRSTPRLRLTVAVLAGVLLLVAVSDRRWAQGLSGQFLQLAGFACIACAALGRVWTSVFIAGSKDRHIVRTGPYSLVRHPLYALSLLAMLGVGLATRSLSISAVLLVLFVAIYFHAARAEDAYLADAHPEAFETYRRAVPAFFLPRGPGERLPATLEVHPRVLWKAFVDAGSLLGYYALLCAADALQRSGVTPSLLHLP